MKNQRVRKQSKNIGFKESYEILSLLIGIILFTLIYYVALKDLRPSWNKFFLIFIADVIVGIISGLISYQIYSLFGRYNYSELNKFSLIKYLYKFFNSFISALCSYFAFVEIIKSYTTTFLEIIVIYGFIKWTIYLTSKWLAKRTIGEDF